MRSGTLGKASHLPAKTLTTLSTTKNLHLLRNCSRDTEARPVREDTTTIRYPKRTTTDFLPEKVETTTTSRTGLPLIAIEIATETGIGTETVIAIEARIHPVAADDTRNLTRMMTVDTLLPRVATLEVQKGTTAVDTAKAPANVNTPRDTKMKIIATDLLIGTDRPTKSTMMMKIRKAAGDTDATESGGIATGTGIGTGTGTGNTTERNAKTHRRSLRVATTRRRCARVVITEVTLGVTSTTLQAFMRANIELGMTPTRCRFRITL
jgi:hypothetical protein